MMDEMMSQAFEPSSSKEKKKTHRIPYIYGFSMTAGPDGKPKIKEFGNLGPNHQGFSKAQIREMKEQNEPLIDVFEQDKTITICAQLPGTRQEDITVNVTETQTTISVDTQKHGYYKKLQLPALVDPKSAKTSYKNGVLQVRLQKILLARTPSRK